MKELAVSGWRSSVFIPREGINTERHPPATTNQANTQIHEYNQPQANTKYRNINTGRNARRQGIHKHQPPNSKYKDNPGDKRTNFKVRNKEGEVNGIHQKDEE